MWTDAVLHEAGDLVLAQELAVDGGHVPGPRDVALAGGRVSLQEHVDRGVAVGMGEQGHAQVVNLAHRLVDEVLGKGGFPPPVLLARWAARVRYGVVKKAVRPWGEPSIVICTPPILKRLL